MPGFKVERLFLPLVKLWNAVESMLLFILVHLQERVKSSIRTMLASLKPSQSKHCLKSVDISCHRQSRLCHVDSVDFQTLKSSGQGEMEGRKLGPAVPMYESYFDDRCDELLQEGVFEQGWPVVMEEVDEQTLDMGAILILSADHQHKLLVWIVMTQGCIQKDTLFHM